MKLKVKFFGSWGQVTGKEEIELYSETVLSKEDLIRSLNKKFPGKFNDREIKGLIFIEKENFKSKPLEDGDLIKGGTVIFISSLEGG